MTKRGEDCVDYDFEEELESTYVPLRDRKKKLVNVI
jgi:hypothetical protein